MINFKAGAFGEIGKLREDDKGGASFSIVGFFISINGFPYDLRQNEYIGYAKRLFCQTEEQASAFKMLLTNHLYNNSDSWGNAEKDWMDIIKSDDRTQTVLVAMNGKYPELTSKSSHVRTRRATIGKLIRDRENGLARDDSWIDAMVYDENIAVRMTVAKYGKKEHLDILVKDSNESVRRQVATHAHPEHLELLTSDHSPLVQVAVAEYGSDENRTNLLKYLGGTFDYEAVYSMIIEKGTEAHRAKVLEQHPSRFVKAGLAKVGFNTEAYLHDKESCVRSTAIKYANKDLITASMAADSSLEVRLAIAERGLFLESFLDDKSERVRISAVRNGDKSYWDKVIESECSKSKLEVVAKGYNLDLLLQDKDEDVRRAAASYPIDIYKLSLA